MQDDLASFPVMIYHMDKALYLQTLNIIQQTRILLGIFMQFQVERKFVTLYFCNKIFLVPGIKG